MMTFIEEHTSRGEIYVDFREGGDGRVRGLVL